MITSSGDIFCAFCSVNTELEVSDLVVFGNAPGEARGTEPLDCLSVEHVLRDHTSLVPNCSVRISHHEMAPRSTSQMMEDCKV